MDRALKSKTGGRGGDERERDEDGHDEKKGDRKFRGGGGGYDM